MIGHHVSAMCCNRQTVFVHISTDNCMLILNRKKIHNAANQKQNSICSSTSMTKKRRRFFQFNSSDVFLNLCVTLCNAKFHFFFPQHHTKFDFTFHSNKHNLSTTTIMGPQKKLTREPRAKSQRDVKVSSLLHVLFFDCFS